MVQPFFIMLTEEQISKYLKAPHHCIYCGGDDISAGEIYALENKAYQVVECMSTLCGNHWDEVFTLTDIEEYGELEKILK